MLTQHLRDFVSGAYDVNQLELLLQFPLVVEVMTRRAKILVTNLGKDVVTDIEMQWNPDVLGY